MVVDFAKVSVQEQPLLILQNLDDTPIGVLKAAFNVEANLCYNDLSTLTFDLPAFINGKSTANYKKTVGMRIIELRNYGRFMLVDPKITDEGTKEIKSCTAYSLEYEFTFKKLPLTAGTYNLWNPFVPKGTILGLILELMPSWRVGQVDATLIDRYRTFDDVGDQNVYNFMKSDLQESYGCIFAFDTYERLIHVRDINTQAPIKPVYFSMENLIKKITIDEDTESIITKLNVYGADGVDIRSVNPMGTSSIIDLGYFMTPENFSQSMIDKYNNWKETFEAYQRPYFNLTVEEALKTAQLVTEQAALVTLQEAFEHFINQTELTTSAIPSSEKFVEGTANLQLQTKPFDIYYLLTIQCEAMMNLLCSADLELWYTLGEAQGQLILTVHNTSIHSEKFCDVSSLQRLLSEVNETLIAYLNLEQSTLYLNASASAGLRRYRKLVEIDPFSLADNDNLTLDDLDYVELT